MFQIQILLIYIRNFFRNHHQKEKKRKEKSEKVSTGGYSRSFSCNQNFSQVLRAVRSPQESGTVTSPSASSSIIRHQNTSNTSQLKSAALPLGKQEKSQLEDKTVRVDGGLVCQNEGLQQSLDDRDKARTVVTKESWSQTDSPPLRDQYTQVEEEEQQSRVARWLACRVVEESLREGVEEEEERGVRQREEEEGRAFGIKGSFGKEETIGAMKVKWAGNMW